MGRPSKQLAELSGNASAAAPAQEIIRVVERAFSVMQCFDSSHGSLSNGDICQMAQLPPSTVSRLTRTLTAIGQLSYSPREQRYALGTAALTMSASWLRGLKSRSAIGALMMDLANVVPGIIAMSARQRLDMVMLECRRSEHAVGAFSDVGSRKSVAYTASGRAYLLAQPDHKREQFLRMLARKSQSDARRLGDWLRENEAVFEAEGIATSVREENPHITGIAVPVWSREQTDYFSLSIGIVSAAYPIEVLRRDVAPRLVALRDDIQALL